MLQIDDWLLGTRPGALDLKLIGGTNDAGISNIYVAACAICTLRNFYS